MRKVQEEIRSLNEKNQELDFDKIFVKATFLHKEVATFIWRNI